MKSWVLLLTLIGMTVCSGLPVFAQDPPDIAAGISPSETYFGSNFEFVDMGTGMAKVDIPLLTDHSQRGGDLNFTYSLHPSGWGSWVTDCDLPYYCEWEPANVIITPGPIPTMEGAISGPYTDYSVGTGQELAVDADSSWHWVFPPTTSASYQESYDGSGIQLPGTCPGSATSCVANRNGIQFLNNYMGASGTAIAEDANGNELTMSSSGGPYNAIFGTDQAAEDPQFGVGNAWTMTDTLGRTWTLAAASGTSGCPSAVSAISAAIWTTPGPGGSTRQFEFCYSSIGIQTSMPYQGVLTYQYSFPFTCLTAVVLPDLTNWQFQYNSYGDMSEITLPTGGTVSYQYTLGGSSDFVASRTLYDGTASHTWHYTWEGPSESVMTDPLGNDTVYSVGSIPGTISSIKYYSGSSVSGGTLLKTETKTYQTLGSYCFDSWMETPLLTAQTTTWGANGPSSQTAMVYDNGSPFTFECFNEEGDDEGTGVYGFLTQQSQSDYYTSGSPPLLTITNNDYKALDTSSYLSPANLLGLVSQTQIKNASSQISLTNYNYDESPSPSGVHGNQTSVQQWISETSGYLASKSVYNSNGLVTSSSDPQGNSTTYGYTPSMYCTTDQGYGGSGPTTVENPLFQTTDYCYDTNTGEVASVTDPNNIKTASYTYDCMLRPTSISYPNSGEETTTYQYGSYTGCGSTAHPYTGAEYTKTVTSSENYTKTTNFDGLGRTIQTSSSVDTSTCSGGDAYVDTTYDADGRVYSTSNPDCTSTSSDDINTTYAYDALGRATLVTEQDGSVVNTSYSYSTSASPPVTCTTVTDESSRVRKSCSDGAGRMTSVWEDPFGLNYETDYTYDANNNLTGFTQKGGGSSYRTGSFTYDSLSRMTGATNPETSTKAYSYGTTTTNLCSGELSAVCEKTDARSQTVAYCYDAVYRIDQKKYNPSSASCPLSSPDIAYSYDSSSLSCPTGLSATATCANIGQRTGMTDPGGSEAWTYYYFLSAGGSGVTDQRTTAGITDTTPIQYTYNLDGTLASLAYASGRKITYGTYVSELPSSAEDMTNSIYYAQTAIYTPFGALTSLTNGSTSTILSSLYYNARMQPCRIAVNSSGSAPGSCVDSKQGNVMDLTYGLNAGTADNGNVMAIANNIDNTRSQTFSYDSLNRVLTGAASTAAASTAHCWGEAYSYDAWGNLGSIGGISSAYTGCTQQNLSGLTFGTNNHITNSGFSYDAAGNLTAESTSGPDFTYNAESQMTQAATSLGTTNYLYDGDGRRVAKESGSTAYELYWYDTSGNVLAETDGSGNLLNEYIFFGGKRIARRKVQ